MHFALLDSLTLPAEAGRPNEDYSAHSERVGVVFDGATGLGDQLLPGPSDAQWIARFGANRLMSHARSGEGDLGDWLRWTMQDAEKSFTALRHRAPKENYEIAVASMMAAALEGSRLECLWFGDCTALYRDDGGLQTIGDAEARRDAERARVATYILKHRGDPAASKVRTEFQPALREARNAVNTDAGGYLFGPDAKAAAHAQSAELTAKPGATLLLATDGFFALVSDYDAHSAEELMALAEEKGLSVLGEELRAIEAGDPDGKRYARFKRHDDATALLLRIEG